MMRGAWTVFRKELLDALRDRRTLLMVLLSSVAIGPLVLLAISGLVASIESRAEQREVYVAGVAHAPTLRNYLERQTYTVQDAPADYEQQLKDSKLGDPVLVIEPGFEAALQRGEAPLVEVVASAANQRAQAGSGALVRLLRGLSPALLEPVEVEERDLASTQARAAQLTALVPFFVMMAVLYGAMHAALDTTAGERERGSLEPLLMNPVRPLSMVVGKWAAVACLGMLIAALSCFSFLPGQWLLRSDTLQALFQFGPSEALAFLLLLAPFAAALSALLMAVAIRCRGIKEAQASSALVVLGVSMLPMVTLFNESGEAPWQLWVPALAQQMLMARVLKGEAIVALQIVIPLGVCVLLTLLGVAYVASVLRAAAVR